LLPPAAKKSYNRGEEAIVFVKAYTLSINRLIELGALYSAQFYRSAQLLPGLMLLKSWRGVPIVLPVFAFVRSGGLEFSSAPYAQLGFVTCEMQETAKATLDFFSFDKQGNKINNIKTPHHSFRRPRTLLNQGRISEIPKDMSVLRYSFSRWLKCLFFLANLSTKTASRK